MKKANANDKITQSYWKLAQNNKLTVSDICKDAKINRSTFYQYYLDIYDLSKKEEDRIIDELIDKINNKFPNSIPNDLSEFTKIIIEIFSKYDKYLYILLENNSLNFQQKLTMSLSKRIPIILNINTDDLYFKYIITYFISNVCTLLKCWYDNNKDLSFEEIALLIHKLVFNGILNYSQN